MKNSIALFAAALCLFLSSCHRPIAYFQPMPRPVIDRMPVEQPTVSAEITTSDSLSDEPVQVAIAPETATASASPERSAVPSTRNIVDQRMHRIQLLLATTTETTDKQPEPKPKKKLKLGNQIRQSLGMKLRPELNWWQRISWKLKASVIVLVVAVIFAILNITVLAIIFGILGAFLMITGLKRSFKVRRPWF